MDFRERVRQACTLPHVRALPSLRQLRDDAPDRRSARQAEAAMVGLRLHAGQGTPELVNHATRLLAEAEADDPVDRAEIIDLRRRLGQAYGDRGDWLAAARWLQSAITLADEPPRLPAGSAPLDLGLVLLRAGSVNRAERQLQAAIERAHVDELSVTAAYATNNLASLYIQTGRYAEASRLLDGQSPISAHFPKRLAAMWSLNLAVARAFSGDLPGAEQLLAHAPTFDDQSPQYLGLLAWSRGRVAMANKEPRRAMGLLESASDIARSLDMRAEELASREAAADAAAAAGDYERAWSHQKRAAELQRGLHDAASALDLEQLQVEFDDRLRRMRERELSETNAQLKAALAELQRQTDDLANARDQAQAASEAKTRFLGMVTHELRTPLHAILGTEELLRLTCLSDEQASLLDTLRGAGSAMLELVEDLLDASSLEAGRVRLDLSITDLVELVTAALRTVASQSTCGEIDLVAEIESGTPRFTRTDRKRLRQILINLLANAAKFTGRGKVGLRVQVVADKLLFEVADQGPGIPRDELARIFEPFYQGDSGATRRHGGAGLGLAIVRQLTSLLGGAVWAESEPGVGSRFYVSLPMLEGTSPSTERWEWRRPPIRTAPSEGSDDMPSGRPWIMVVDDDPTCRWLHVKLLEKLGFQALALENGQQALDRIDQDLRLILLDWMMPDLSGPQVAQAIRGRGWSGPILGLTAHAGPEERALAPEVGIQVLLTKPLGLTALQQELASVFPGGPPGGIVR